MAVTVTLESARRRTPEGHWRCTFNHRHPLQCGRDSPSFAVTAQRSVRRTSIDTHAPPPMKRRPKFPRTPRRVDRRAATVMRRPADTRRRLTMRLSDVGLRCRQTKLIYPNHRLPLWPNEDAAPRSLEPIVRRPHMLTLVGAMTLAQLPAYTADRPLRNLPFERPDTSNCGLSGGAMAVTLTLESARRRTPEAPWRCVLNYPCPLRCGCDSPSFCSYRSAKRPSRASRCANATTFDESTQIPAHRNVSIAMPRH